MIYSFSLPSTSSFASSSATSPSSSPSASSTSSTASSATSSSFASFPFLVCNCSCEKFQSDRIPCSHAIATCMNQGLNSWSYIDPCYRIDVNLQVYGGQFYPVPHEGYWLPHFGLTWVPDPDLRRKKGRPMSSRIRNEMDWKEGGKHSYTCRNCRQSGHSTRTCRNPTRT